MTKRNMNARDHRKFFGKKQCWICGNICEGRRRHYCSDECGNKMQNFVNSTTWNLIKENALIRDNKTCVLCGNGMDHIHKEKKEIIDKMGKLHEIIIRELKKGKGYPQIPEDRERCKLESRLDYLESHTLVVDHKLPICMGGDPFDLENLQTLCIPCNKRKTRHDLISLKYFRRCATDIQRSEFAEIYMKTLKTSGLIR